MTQLDNSVIQRKAYPRISKVTQFDSQGLLFHAADSREAYRTEKFGGEVEFTRMLLEDLESGEVFYDIGACVGIISLHAAKKGSHVVAFEPDPILRKRLAENIELNQIESVDVIDWAVGDAPGTATLFSEGANGAAPSLRGGDQRGRVEIRVEAIDRAIARGEIAPPHVIKIDVEGAEALALRGMSALLHSSAAPRSVFIELHPQFLPDFGSDIDSSTAVLENAGYSVCYEEAREDQIHRIYRKAA